MSLNTDPVIELEGVTKVYRKGGEVLTVLDQLDMLKD